MFSNILLSFKSIGGLRGCPGPKIWKILRAQEIWWNEWICMVKKPEIDANHKLLLQIASNLNRVKFGVKIWNFEKIDPLGSKFDPKLTPGVKIFKILSTIPKFVSDDSEQLLFKKFLGENFFIFDPPPGVNLGSIFWKKFFVKSCAKPKLEFRRLVWVIISNRKKVMQKKLQGGADSAPPWP